MRRCIASSRIRNGREDSSSRDLWRTTANRRAVSKRGARERRREYLVEATGVEAVVTGSAALRRERAIYDLRKREGQALEDAGEGGDER